MRPTNNQFKSPKARTGEYTYPVMGHSGHKIFEAIREETFGRKTSTPQSNWNKEDRFKTTYGSIYVRIHLLKLTVFHKGAEIENFRSRSRLL